MFGLPKTHVVEYAGGTCQDHLDFLVWSLSFFVGMRLTATDAGFLDATPVKPGKLVDFVPVGETLGRGMELAERFWLRNRKTPRNAKLYQAAIHALFLSQNPRGLEFEMFMYLYFALDACYELARSLRNPKANHRQDERIEWLCEELGLVMPDWARRPKSGTYRGSEVSRIRNSTVHEALFVDAPLGFAIRHDDGRITLEMSALVAGSARSERARVVTGGKSGIQASRGKGSAKSFPRAVFVPACYGAPRSPCWRLCQHLGRAAAARTSSEDRGQPGGGPAVEPAWTAARRDEAEARAEHPCHAGSSPGSRRRRVAPKPGSRPLPDTARRSRRFGRQREERRGHHAARLRVRRIPEGTVDCPSELSYPTPAPRSRGAPFVVARRDCGIHRGTTGAASVRPRG